MNINKFHCYGNMYLFNVHHSHPSSTFTFWSNLYSRALIQCSICVYALSTSIEHGYLWSIAEKLQLHWLHHPIMKRESHDRLQLWCRNVLAYLFHCEAGQSNNSAENLVLVCMINGLLLQVWADQKSTRPVFSVRSVQINVTAICN